MEMINNIPLPTDSLYKFMALSGLIITLVFLIFPIFLKRKLNFIYIDLHRDINIEKERIDLIEGQQNNLDQIVKEGQDNLESLHDIGVEIFSDKSLKMLSGKANNATHKIIKVSERTHRIAAEINKLKYLCREIRYIKLVSMTGIFIGLSLSLSGFVLWYIKLQKYIDIIYVTGQTP